MATLKTAVYRTIEAPQPGDQAARLVDAFLCALILANVAAVILESVDEIAAIYRPFFDAFELFSVTVFSIEFLVRLWVATEKPANAPRGPIRDRVRYIVSLRGIADLLAILPFFLAVFLAIDARYLRALRLLRLLKLVRYTSVLEIFWHVLHGQRRPLFATAVLMFLALLLAATTAYLLEGDAQPKVFGTIPNAMWWTVVTLTTLGYGDVVPVTPPGKILGGVVAMTGVLMLALPTGILANGFAEEIRKREFVVTWRLVAHVPLFAHLDAVAISDIAALLKPKLVPPGYRIVERGARADSMYFIVMGEVEVDIQPTPLKLLPGDFFGEIAILKECERTATVTAITTCQLLILEARDFGRLLRDHPSIADALTKTMGERLTQLEKSNVAT